MDLKTFVRRIEPYEGLFSTEWLVVGYAAVTSLFIAFFFNGLQNPVPMLLGRVGIVAGIVALMWIYRLYPCRLTVLLRMLFQFSWLSFWYSETYEFNSLLPNLDHYFAQAEQWMFGSQPAYWFRANFPQHIVSEAMNLGYVSLFPLIAWVVLWYFFLRFDAFEKVAFVVEASFLLYYLMYMVIPVAGPQFYFPVIGEESVLQGIFPAVGSYFSLHPELPPDPDGFSGFFYNLVEMSQAVGERPTAAFPSSHVGISSILMILAWRGSRKLFCYVLPFFVLLCLSTVYIQAHYVIDVLAGFASAVMLYAFCVWAYRRWFCGKNLPFTR